MNRGFFKWRRVAVCATILLTLSAIGVAGAAAVGERISDIAPAMPLVPIGPAAAVRSLTVMSYNVEGLPVPARFGRASSLERIGAGLSALRRHRRQPNVVLLQEAFAERARQIAGEGGYRYVADGPSASEVNRASPPAAASALIRGASHLKGEDDGKWVGSGLRVLSDYPIVKVERLAFPAWACAGYDCLANKGAVIAWIRIPGSPQPVAFIDTHLNSRAASGVCKPRADTAYAFQVAILRKFIAEEVPTGSMAFLGGDFNSGKAQVRQADLAPGLLPRSRNSLRVAMVADSGVAMRDGRDTHAILRRAKDWLFYRGNSRGSVTLIGFDVPFGHQADGSTLSDHLGYEAHYRIGGEPA